MKYEPIKFDLLPITAPEYREIPAYMREGLYDYINQGVPPGDFLTKVLENDLMGACDKADMSNRLSLFAYASFLYNYAPKGCYGTPFQVYLWIERGGLKGRPD